MLIMRYESLTYKFKASQCHKRLEARTSSNYENKKLTCNTGPPDNDLRLVSAKIILVILVVSQS